MTRPSAFFLVPEWGQWRSHSLRAYLEQRYRVDIGGLELPPHSRSPWARAARNSLRLLRGRPPLFDRYSGFSEQVERQLRGDYDVAVVEHFWCASYAAVLRPLAKLLVLDLHNIESALARSHAGAVGGAEAIAFQHFADAYETLEREWLPRYDVLLVASEEDRQRVDHPNVIVYPNALPEWNAPAVAEAPRIVFSGNLEYHPNVAAVEWFHARVWPRLREEFPDLEWRLVGRNPHAVASGIQGDPRIRTTGAIDDALPELAAAQVCVVPLLSGSGTRFKILEAWAAGRAVVSTSIGAEGLGGISGEHLLIADDAAAFQSAVARLLCSPELRRRLGDSGQRLYRESFTWPKAWQALTAAGI
jgi:polysaccharide biosynthesis protein PslH